MFILPRLFPIGKILFLWYNLPPQGVVPFALTFSKERA
jgi:hypothetical protein